MQVLEVPETVRAYSQEQKKVQKSIGFVPTMGALHQGHATLIQEAKQLADQVIVSIYVNPLQFNQAEDLRQYPRNLAEDLRLLEAWGCDIAFVPQADAMYKNPVRLHFELGDSYDILEGKDRPKHFNGVAIILCKLFHMVEPDWVCFGEKDWQQCLLVQQLIDDLGFRLRLHTVPTVRNAQGLALSSRNQRLSSLEQSQATVLYKALCFAQEALMNTTINTPRNTSTSPASTTLQDIKQHVHQQLAQSPLCLAYFEILYSDPFIPISSLPVDTQKSLSLCIAGTLNGLRLIDHIRYKPCAN